MTDRVDPTALRQALSPFSPSARLSPALLNPYLDLYGGWSRLHTRHAEPAIGWLDTPICTIAMQYWAHAQPRGCCLLVPGYLDHMAMYLPAIEFWLAAGYSVLTFDLPGHGLSGGPAVEIADFADYQTVLQAVLAAAPVPITVAMGQSTGGAILADYLLRQPSLPTVLLAPLLRPREFHFARLTHALVGRWLPRWPRRFQPNSHDAEFLRHQREDDPLQSRSLSVRWVGAMLRWQEAFSQAGEQPAASVLLVQGMGDRTVDWRYNLPRYQQRFSTLELVRIPDAGHQLVQEGRRYQQVWQAAVQRWLEQRDE